jgi:hypothetical protein
MTALSSLSLLLGVGLLLLSLRLEEDWRARYPVLGSLSPLAVTRAASACLVAFGGIGVTIAVALPDSDQWAARMAMVGGVSAATLAIFVTSRASVDTPSMISPALASDDQTSDDDGLVGSTGTFVAPASKRAAGRVLIRRGSRTLEIAAKPAGGVMVPNACESVVVVDVFQGTALVAPVQRDDT